MSYGEINVDFSRFIAGNEEGLAAYWRLNTGLANDFYDFSRQGGFDFNENHGQIVRGEWSETTPLSSQLSYRGITDSNGNYIIGGFPFETSGSLYTFTPIFENHSFEPVQQLRFVGDGAFIFNEVDYTDVSSFPVSGTIFYKNTPFPVEGISILVDGISAVDEEGNAVTSDVNGEFTVDVPIGFHSIRLVRTGHEFENEGRFPFPLEGSDEIQLFDLQEPLSGLVFQDATLRKLAGKVVGGPIEQEKLLGFGLSKNNIGNATILLRPTKLADLTFTESDSTVNVVDAKIENDVSFNIRDITISPDQNTGEFVAMLPPEQYFVVDVFTTNYNFDETYNTTINMIDTTGDEEIRQDTVFAEVAGDTIFSQLPFVSAEFDTVFTAQRADTTFTVAQATFSFDKRNDFILRQSPQIDVTNLEYEEIFGDSIYVYQNQNLGVEEELSLINRDHPDNIYTLGHPAFNQNGNYAMRIRLFEEYEDEVGIFHHVPVVDGEIAIINELAVNDEEIRLTLNRNGEARYSFKAGFPNISLDDTNPEKSYTRTLNLTAFSGNNGTVQTVWREGNSFRGIVLGGLPTGNNFVTNGPNKILTILRDPPGSASYAYIEEGTTISTSENWSNGTSNGKKFDSKTKIGMKTATFKGVVVVGAAVGTISESETKADIDFGLSNERTNSSDSSVVNTTTITRTIQTSDDPAFVGRDGDVFVGHSTNIVYGQARNIELIPAADCLDDNCIETNIPGYKLGLNDGLRINPEFATFFILTQFTIESYTIPNLTEIRNSFLIHSTQPDTINPVSEPVYVSLLAQDDERYGSDNFDESVWGELAEPEIGIGPSYVIRVPQSFIDDDIFVNDTITYFNQQIKDWKNVLAENERIKLTADPDRNISFDGGTSLEESLETSRTEESTTQYNFVFNKEVGISKGLETSIFGSRVGFDITTSRPTAEFNGDGTSDSEENNTIYGFVLNDSDHGDSYTVDLKKPSDGFGTIFSTLGGATSCPYEDAVLTKYFNPGEQLSAATAQREVPGITVDQNVISEIPSNRKAVYTILLTNESESGDGFEMVLDLVDGTNPHGAIIEIDGAPIGNGLVFQVEAGQVLTKTLTLAKGQDDINAYEDIRIELESLCQADPNDHLPDIADEISISAFFQPGCSDIEMTVPVDQWVLNSRAPLEGMVGINITDYDLNLANFERIDFQYKAASSSLWITDRKFYNPQEVTQEEYDALDEPKAMIEGSNVAYNFDLNALPDRDYDVRAVSRCVLGPGNEVFTPTDILRGIKDVKRPQPFGAPQPADGILSANDQISIQFDETIEAALINNSSVSVKGVLNNTEITNNTSVKFDGVNDYMRIEGLTLPKDFTIFFWLRRDVFGEEYVIFSQGTTLEDRLEIGFGAGNKFKLNVSGQVIESSLTFPTTGNSNWEYYAVSYDADRNEISAYRNGSYVLENVALTDEFSGFGSIAIGKSALSDDRYFEGNVHELRVWNTSRSISEVIAGKSVSLSGNELNLAGYWPMNEGRGSLAIDKARSRNGVLFADWQIDPQGAAVRFDGVDDYLEIPTGSTVTISEDQDFAIEFWFNATSGQRETVLFSVGKADGTDQFSAPKYSWNIGIGYSGDLFVLHNGTNLPLPGSAQFVDDNWHHFALSMNRVSNLTVFIDEQQQASVSSSNYGGLAAGEMWIGARGYKEGTISNNQDQFFEGLIDEFRIWNTARRANQISDNINIAQQRDEVGLVAYYPFEFFEIQAGIPLRTPSLQDLAQENGGMATAFGGAAFATNTANIRVANPVSSIDFDWVVNNDEIIFNLAESFSSLIEQTIVTISVRGVEDKLQNRLASPVSWTAFIDRNQMKWSIGEIEISKEVYEPSTFDANVMNLGGTEESFEITNLPPWLSASPASGTLAPNSETTVKFSIDAGLNTGYYQEDVFLSTDFGFDEKLSLDVSVFSPSPDWTVNAQDFQYSMNVVGQLDINGVISRDVNDRVAAFVGDEIRGMVNVEYISEVDAYLAYLTIYSHVTSEEDVELRVWDASSGLEYRENVAPAITFSTNQVLGSDSAPIMIQVGNTIVQNITLDQGWNWVSFGVSNSNFGNLNLILQDLPAAFGFQIKSQEFADTYTPGIGWSGSLSQSGGFNTGEMYRFFVDDEDLEVIGVPVAVAQHEISLNEGWNWLGFTPRFNQTVAEALGGLQNVAEGDVIKSQFLFAVYRESLGWIGTLDFLEPGKGYLIRKANADRFTYPESTGLARLEGYENLQVSKTHSYEHNMTLVGAVTGLDTDGKYELQVVDEAGNFRGAISEKNVGGEDFYFLTVQGNKRENLTLFALDLETGDLFESNTELSFASNTHLGSTERPVLFDFATHEEARVSEIVMFPNPFEDKISVQFSGQENEVPEVAISDLAGRKIKTLDLAFDGNMNWTTEWDGTHGNGERANPGIYILRLRVGSDLSSFKISLK